MNDLEKLEQINRFAQEAHEDDNSPKIKQSTNRRKQVSLYLSEEQKKDLDRIVRYKGIPMQDLIREPIEKMIQREKQKIMEEK